MEIFVQGTKHGWNTLYPKPTPEVFFKFAMDIRREDSDSNNKDFYGKYLYSIAVSNNGYIFTKNIIIYDVKRAWLGFIGISIHIPKNKKLNGIEIKNLLDQLTSTYVEHYCQDFNLDNVQEDWSLFTSLVNKHESKLKIVSPFPLDFNSLVVQDPAFIYYKNDEELINYFNSPFQEIYCNFKQVFLVEENFRNKIYNPLNALRHSGTDLTGVIDLENPFYNLKYNSTYGSDLKIVIKVNGREKLDNSKIRKKDNLEISWLKPFHKTENKIGKCNEIGSDFINADENNNTFYINQIELIPEEKTISFIILDYHSSPLENSEIKINNHDWQKINGHKFEYSVRGIDIGKRCTVSVRHGDAWFLDEYLIDVNKQCQGETCEISLKLNKRKIIKFSGLDPETSVLRREELKISIIDKRIYNDNISRVTFINEEIDKKYIVQTEFRIGNYLYKGEKTFAPKYDDEVQIELKKQIIPKQKKYKIEPGKNGKKKENSPGYSINKEGDDVKNYIVSNFNWKFLGFEMENVCDDPEYDGTLVAQYKQKYKLIKVASISFSAIILIAAAILLFPYLNQKSDNNFNLKHEIKNYVEGIELNVDSLNNYSKKLDEYPNKNSFSWLDKIFKPTTNDSVNIDTEKMKDWINKAYRKRQLVDDLNFQELKSENYSDKQQIFKSAFVAIDSSRYQELKTKLGNVDKNDLDQIATAIQDILKSTNKKEEDTIELNKDEQKVIQKQNSPSSKNNAKSGTIEKNVTNKIAELPKQKTNLTRSISESLKSGAVTKDSLVNWKNVSNNDKINKSIDLYLQVWEALRISNQKEEFDNLLNQVRQDNILKNSALKKLLEKICNDSDSFQKYLNMPGKSIFNNVNDLIQKN